VVKNSEYKEDIKQDMLFRMIKYKPQFTKLKGDQIYYYIAFILKQILTLYNKGFDYCDEMLDNGYNQNIEQSIDNQSIMNNLTMLSRYERELVELYYIQGLNYREISEQTKIPITSLNLTIRTAIKKIQQYYGL
jgi:RNA polymerase sigma factor (sigma-70 family)